MKEFEIIKNKFLPLSQPIPSQVNQNPKKQILNSFNFSDDVSLIKKSNNNFIVSKDIFIENVHFLRSDGGEKIAQKLLLTNISDIASSGGEPLFYFLGFTKNSNLKNKFYDDFALGLKKIQEKFNIVLAGGDTSNSNQLFYSVTIFGAVDDKKILLRKNAVAGDLIYVSNHIGDAFLGLDIKLKKPKKLLDFHKKLLDKHFYPIPRINLSKILSQKQISKCATDISDGLIADLEHICEASNLIAEIDLSKIPISADSKKYLQENQHLKILDLISGGDDYEIIFSSHPDNAEKINQLSQELNLKLTCIGKFLQNNSKKTINSKICKVKLYQDFITKKLIKFSHKGYEHK